MMMPALAIRLICRQLLQMMMTLMALLLLQVPLSEVDRHCWRRAHEGGVRGGLPCCMMAE